MYSLLRPLVFCLDPEKAHHLALNTLKTAACCGILPTVERDTRPTELMGLTLPNPVGLAAGLDLPEAMRLANAAAGVVVGKLGTAVCSFDELAQSL